MRAEEGAGIACNGGLGPSRGLDAPCARSEDSSDRRAHHDLDEVFRPWPRRGSRQDTHARRRLPHSYLDAARHAPNHEVMRLAVVALVLCACHVRAGFDTTARSSGPLAMAIKHPNVTRTDGVLELPPVEGRTYSIGGGFGDRHITIGMSLAAHDATQASFAPGTGYLAMTAAIDLRWTILRIAHLAPVLDVGPARMMLLDRNTGDRTWGNGLRFGGGLQLVFGRFAIYGDAYREVMVFDGGAAKGTSTLDGVTVGLALTP